MHHVPNRFGDAPSYNIVDLILKRLMFNVKRSPNGTLSSIPRHEIAVFSIDNLDVNNNYGLLVHGSNKFGLHLTAIQGAFCNVESTIPRGVFVREEYLNKHR